QPVRKVGFGQESDLVVGRQVPLDVFGRVPAGADDVQVGGVGLQRPRQRAAAHTIGHHHVRHHQINVAGATVPNGQSFAAISRLDYVVAARFQGGAGHFPDD